MTRNALYFAILACVASLATGWGLGLMMSTRVNTIAAQAYISALDIEARGRYEAQAATERADCTRAQAESAKARKDDEARSAARIHDDQVEYSERILGLQQQLRANGIRELVVR